MINAKGNGIKKVNVVKKVNVPATIRQIPHGITARFSREELGGELTVRSAISRENSKCPTPEFTLNIIEFGKYYLITRS